MFGLNRKNVDNDPRLQPDNLSKKEGEFDLTKASKWGNQKCHCGSGQKYKKRNGREFFN